MLELWQTHYSVQGCAITGPGKRNTDQGYKQFSSQPLLHQDFRLKKKKKKEADKPIYCHRPEKFMTCYNSEKKKYCFIDYHMGVKPVL